MSLMEKLKKNSTVKETAILNESKVFGKKDMIPTTVPMINVALSGSIDGGLTPGLTMIAGPSKHFKSAFSLLLAKSFLRKYPEGVILFYDSEFGTPESYFKTFGIPADRVLHTPVTDVEQLKFDLAAQLAELTRTDKVIIIVDSVGNLASKKEVEDALKQNSAADMSRAKALKSLFRIVTPHLTMKDIPMVVVNHTYKEIALYPKDIVGGGTGSYYSADTIWIVGRSQEKEGDEVVGSNFNIVIEKSRFVKEKAKIGITVKHTGGIDMWSGLFENALEGGYIAKPSNGWYQLVDRATGELTGDKMRLKDFDGDGEFWLTLFDETDFGDYIKAKYTLANHEIMPETEH